MSNNLGASKRIHNWSTLPVEKNENRSWNLFYLVLGGAVVFVGFINGWSFL